MRKNARLPRILGRKIQRMRKRSKLTQEKLAEKVGISITYMGFIEQGRYIPSVELLEKLSKALKIPLSNLF